MDTHTALQKRVKEKFLTHVHSRRVLPMRFPCALLLTTSEDSFALRNEWVYHWITIRSASRETCKNLLVATHAKCVQLSFDSDFLNILNGLYCSWRWLMIRTQKWSLRLNKNWSRGGDSEKIEKSFTAAGIEPGTKWFMVSYTHQVYHQRLESQHLMYTLCRVPAYPGTLTEIVYTRSSDIQSAHQLSDSQKCAVIGSCDWQNPLHHAGRNMITDVHLVDALF